MSEYVPGEPCPTCGHVPSQRGVYRRLCFDCKKPIRLAHKWYIGPDQRIRHRHCDEPDAYVVMRTDGTPALGAEAVGAQPLERKARRERQANGTPKSPPGGREEGERE